MITHVEIFLGSLLCYIDHFAASLAVGSNAKELQMWKELNAAFIAGLRSAPRLISIITSERPAPSSKVSLLSDVFSLSLTYMYQG